MFRRHSTKGILFVTVVAIALGVSNPVFGDAIGLVEEAIPTHGFVSNRAKECIQ